MPLAPALCPPPLLQPAQPVWDLAVHLGRLSLDPIQPAMDAAQLWAPRKLAAPGSAAAGAAAAPAPSPPSILSLPDSMLARILEAAGVRRLASQLAPAGRGGGQDAANRCSPSRLPTQPLTPLRPSSPCRSSITLVCRCWLRIFYAEAALWRCLKLGPPAAWAEAPSGGAQQLQEAWFHGRRRQLQRCGGQAESLIVRDGCVIQGAAAVAGKGWRLEELLLCLEPCPHLASVNLDCRLSAGLALWLGRRSGLTFLDLASAAMPPEAAGALCQLSTLRTLRLNAAENSMPVDLCGSLLLLSSLTELSLSATPLPPNVGQLTQLQALESLDLLSCSPNLALPHPAAFPRLAQCALTTYSPSVVLGVRHVLTCKEMPQFESGRGALHCSWL